jgi:hypothetical protein
MIFSIVARLSKAEGMSNLWDDLPNAKHINFVIEQAGLYPFQYAQHRNALCNVISDEIKVAIDFDAWEIIDASNVFNACDKAMDKAWWSIDKKLKNLPAYELLVEEVEGMTPYRCQIDAAGAVWDAIVGLLAYKDCHYLLHSDPEEVKLLVRLGSPSATLLYPVCLAINSCNTQK